MATDWQLCDADTGRVVIPRLELACTWWRRFVGLQFRRELHDDAGLLLVPCNSIHTCCVRFAIDVALLAADGKVLAVHRAVRPWRGVFPVKGARAVLETRANAMRLQPNDCVTLCGPSESAPAGTRFPYRRNRQELPNR
jgi:uncharacterized membrane protein (UPF0127 family)